MTEVFTIYGEDNSPYMTRVILGRLRLHVFHRGDADPDMHDHPADFWTFPLVSYVEEVPQIGWQDGQVVGWRTERRVVSAFRLHRRRAELAHRVVGRWTGAGTETDDGQIATIVWWGKKRREWGFHTPNGWTPWRTYLGLPHQGEAK